MPLTAQANPATAGPRTDPAGEPATLRQATTHGGHRAAPSRPAPGHRGPPLPPAPTRRQATPAHLLSELTAELRALGHHHLYATAYPTEGVLSVACGITIWTNGHTLRCHTPLGTIPLPTSPHAAARQLTHLTPRPA
jgi:hypothetical protein